MIKKQNAGIYDQFYTKPQVAKALIKNIDISKYELIIQPSAGNGSFSKQIKNCMAYDIDPKDQSIIKGDYLQMQIITNPQKTLVIGNPPFGRQSSLAFKFIKKSMLIADTVAFILPKSFRKVSYIDRVPLTHQCVLQIDLDDNSFIVDSNQYSVPCVFQIWERCTINRIKHSNYHTNDFQFCSKKQAQLSIRRVGWYAGIVYSDIDKSQSSFYFVKQKNKDINYIKQKLQSIDYNDVKDNSAGIRTISKRQIIMKYVGE